MLCTIEMFERLAFYALRSVAPIYIMQADDPGGLHLTAGQKGTIYAFWAAVQSIFPMVTGGYADRYGYKKTLAFAFTLNVAGYVMMAYLRSYAGFFAGVLVLATGTAFFKPALQGSLAQNLTKANSSLGWGIFYWIVNVGAVIGPFVSTALLGDDHTKEGWRNLFLACAGFTCLNYLLLFTYRDIPSGASKTDNPFVVFVRTIRNVFEPRLMAFLAIMSCFWLMMYQLWDLHPNFITDWVDSSPLARSRWIPESWVMETPRGPQVQQQMLLNLNAALIVVCVIPVAWIVRRMRTLSAMLIGTGMAIGGILVAGWTMSVFVLLLGIALFSAGEMLTGPKKNEYLGLIAPPGKKGLYLGYVNIPVGVGVYVGSLMAGFIYGRWGEKSVLALKYLAEHTPFGADKGWDGSVHTLEATLGVPRTEAMERLQEVLGVDAATATRLLWDTYHPHYVWLPFAAIGIMAAIALAVYGRMARRWKDMDA